MFHIIRVIEKTRTLFKIRYATTKTKGRSHFIPDNESPLASSIDGIFSSAKRYCATAEISTELVSTTI